MDKKMPGKTISEKEIKNILNTGEIGGLYFIFGNESYLKIHYTNAIAGKAVNKDFEDFNLHRFDGKTTSVEKIAEAVEAMPIFSERTCVIVNDLPIHELEQPEIDNLKLILNDIPKTCSLILLMDTIEKKIKKVKPQGKDDLFSEIDTDADTEIIEEKQKKENVWDEILKIAFENGYAIELNKKNNADLADILVIGAKKRGYKIEFETAKYLTEVVGNDLSSLQNELDKVCSYVNTEVITKSDIDKIAVKSIEARVFDMTKSLLDNNITNACLILDTLLPESLVSKKETAIQIMGALISPFIDMYRAKIAVNSGFQSINVAKYYNYKEKEFKLTNSARDAAALSVKQLRNCLDLLDEADSLLKSRSISPKLVVEQTMVRILSTINSK